jgi:hypothetical protein
MEAHRAGPGRTLGRRRWTAQHAHVGGEQRQHPCFAGWRAARHGLGRRPRSRSRLGIVDHDDVVVGRQVRPCPAGVVGAPRVDRLAEQRGGSPDLARAGVGGRGRFGARRGVQRFAARAPQEHERDRRAKARHQEPPPPLGRAGSAGLANTPVRRWRAVAWCCRRRRRPRWRAAAAGRPRLQPLQELLEPVAGLVQRALH